MMNQDEQDILKSIFSRLPDDTLPPGFQSEMMQQIKKEATRIAKRNQWLSALALIVATMITIGLAVAALVYMGIPPITTELPSLTIPSYYIYFGLLVLLLLFTDSILRQIYYKKHSRT